MKPINTTNALSYFSHRLLDERGVKEQDHKEISKVQCLEAVGRIAKATLPNSTENQKLKALIYFASNFSVYAEGQVCESEPQNATESPQETLIELTKLFCCDALDEWSYCGEIKALFRQLCHELKYTLEDVEEKAIDQVKELLK